VPQRLSLLLAQDVRDPVPLDRAPPLSRCSAFFVTPFEDAAVLSVDGIRRGGHHLAGPGARQSPPLTSLSSGIRIRWVFFGQSSPRFLGFGNYGQWKVMALAAYGDPDRFYPAFRTFVECDDSGNFEVDGRTTAVSRRELRVAGTALRASLRQGVKNWMTASATSLPLSNE